MGWQPFGAVVKAAGDAVQGNIKEAGQDEIGAQPSLAQKVAVTLKMKNTAF